MELAVPGIVPERVVTVAHGSDAMLECISGLSRIKGPKAQRIVAMLRRTGCRMESHDVGRHVCYALDGWAYLVRRGVVLRLDWFEFCHVLRQRAKRKAVVG